MTVEQHQRRTRREVLTMPQGLAAGLLGAAVLTVVSAGLLAAAGHGAWQAINAAGAFVLRGQAISGHYAGALSLVGGGLIAVTGALLGVLYASAQEVLDAPSLFFIAMYYGAVSWIVSNFGVLSWLAPAVKTVWQSWPVFLGHLGYGATLGLIALRALRAARGAGRKS